MSEKDSHEETSSADATADSDPKSQPQGKVEAEIETNKTMLLAEDSSSASTIESATDPTTSSDPTISSDPTNSIDSNQMSRSESKPEPKQESSKRKETKHKQKKKKATTATKSFPFLSSISILLLLAVGAAAGFGYRLIQQQLQQQVDDSKQQNAALNNRQQELQTQLASFQQLIDALQTKNATLESAAALNQQAQQNVENSVKHISAQVTALAVDKGKEPLQWRLAEVDYLLSVANHRLIMERDVKTALSAFADADSRLESIGDPALIPVRDKITGEITELKSLPKVDIAGMASQLASFVSSIEQLPLVNKERVYQRETAKLDRSEISSIGELGHAVWSDITNNLFKIQRSTQPVEPLLPPQEKYYLSQNLALKLEEARIALLRSNTEVFRQNLADIKEWIHRYFDHEASAVQTIVVGISEMEKVVLMPDIPDVSGSLRSLRRWVKKNNLAQYESLLKKSATQQLAHVEVTP